MLRLLAPAILLIASAPVHGAIIVLDLLDPTGIANTAGEAFESAGSYTESGVTFTVSATSVNGSMSGSFSANGSSAGVDTDGQTGAQGDATSEIDSGETLIFTMSFSGLNLLLTAIDFDEVGAADGDDAGLVSIAGAVPVVLETGVADFNGTSDVWTPTGGVEILSGESIAISAEDNVELISISFSTASAAVPEPTHFAFLFSCAAVAVYRKRR